MARALARTSARSPAATTCSATPSRPTRPWRCCNGSRAAAAASTSSPAASSSASSPPAATRRGSSSPASARRAPRCERALAVDVLCFNVESVGELELLSEVASRAGRRARVSLRVNPDVDPKTHPYISTGLRANKFGIAHDDARGRVRARRAPARPRGGRHRLPHRLADRRGRAVRRRARSPARPGRARRGRRRAARAHRRRRRPRHHLRDETPPDAGALVARLLERIDARGHGHRKILFEPGRSLVGNAGVLVERGALPEARQRAQLLHRRRGDERPDAAGDVRRLDARSSSARRAPAAAVTWDVVGPVCESGDWLGRERASRSPPATSSPCSPPAPTP